MLQAALLHVMNMFHIPDVDLLKQIYDSAIVRVDPMTLSTTFNLSMALSTIFNQLLANLISGPVNQKLRKNTNR